MKISACMIVKNESNNIEKNINSYKDIVDEIIVVDTGSTDNTAELANKLGAKVLYMEWKNDFAAPRNFAIDNAKGDWILFLDADEYFAEGSSQKLLKSLEVLNKENKYNCLSCKMYHLTSDGAIKGQNVVIRAFKRKDSIRYKNSVHENLMDNGKNLNSLYFEDIIIYHTGYSESKILSKYHRNIDMLKNVEASGKADTMTYYYLCSSYNGIKDFVMSVKYADKTFEEEKRSGFIVPRVYRYKVYTSKIQSMGLMGDIYRDEEIEKVVNEAIAEYPTHPEVLWIKAQFLTRIKKFREALSCYLDAIEANKNSANDMCNYFDSYMDQAYLNIGVIYIYLNNEDTAAEYFVRALEKDKFNKDAAIRLLRAIRDYKDEFIISIINKIYDINNFTDMQFLINILCETKLSIPLIYYTKKWNSIFEQEDISVLLSMIAMGKYQEAIKLGLITAKSDEMKTGLDIALAGILLAGSEEEYKNALSEIDQGAYHLLEMLINKDYKLNIDDKIINLFKSVLNIIIPYGSNTFLTGFMELILSNFTDNITYVLFDQLLFYNKYELAKEYYKKLHNKAIDDDVKNKSSFIAGFSAYRGRKYSEAVELFTDAIRNGYNDIELAECLEIINDQCMDEATKVDIANAKSLFIKTNELSKLKISRDRENEKRYIKQPNDIEPDMGKKVAALNLPNTRYEAVSFMFENNPLVSIIVLAYNKVEFTRQCIESIYKYTEGIDYELILVNNGSTDETQKYFESLPKKKIVHIEKNHGPCNGFNDGIKAAKGRYVACVCNDFIFTKNWLSNLITCIRSDDRIGFVSPGASYMSNYQQINGSYNSIEEMQKFAETYNISNSEKWEERIRLLPNVLFVKREIFDIVGYYDPVFVYGEFADDDLAFRIRRAGYKLVYAGDTFTYHYGSVTGGKAQRENKSLEVSREIFKSKHDIDAWNDVVYDMNLIYSIDYGERCVDSRKNILGVDPLCGATILQIKNRFRSKGQNEVGLFALTRDPKYYVDLATICDEVVCGTVDILSGSFVNTEFDYIVLNSPINNYHDYYTIFGVLKCKLKVDGHIILSLKNDTNFLTLGNYLSERNLSEHVKRITEKIENFNKDLIKMNLRINKYVIENCNLSVEQDERLNKLCNAQRGFNSDEAKKALKTDRYIMDITGS